MDADVEIAGGMVVVTTSGTATGADLEQVIDVVADHPAVEAGMPMLFDHSRLEVGDLAGYDIRGVAEAFLAREDALGHGRKAIVVPGDAAYGLARMFAVYAESERLNVQVFRARDAALAWLGGS